MIQLKLLDDTAINSDAILQAYVNMITNDVVILKIIEENKPLNKTDNDTSLDESTESAKSKSPSMFLLYFQPNNFFMNIYFIYFIVISKSHFVPQE